MSLVRMQKRTVIIYLTHSMQDENCKNAKYDWHFYLVDNWRDDVRRYRLLGSELLNSVQVLGGREHDGEGLEGIDTLIAIRLK